jgi:hypothetical protein
MFPRLPAKRVTPAGARQGRTHPPAPSRSHGKPAHDGGVAVAGQCDGGPLFNNPVAAACARPVRLGHKPERDRGLAGAARADKQHPGGRRERADPSSPRRHQLVNVCENAIEADDAPQQECHQHRDPAEPARQPDYHHRRGCRAGGGGRRPVFTRDCHPATLGHRGRRSVHGVRIILQNDN